MAGRFCTLATGARQRTWSCQAFTKASAQKSHFLSQWSESVPRPVQTQRCGLFVQKREACPRSCLQADCEHRALDSPRGISAPAVAA